MRHARILQSLVFLAGDILYNILHPAGKDSAQVIDGGGGNRLVLSELVDGGAGDIVVFDQGIGGFAGRTQGLPEWIERDHRFPPKTV